MLTGPALPGAVGLGALSRRAAGAGRARAGQEARWEGLLQANRVGPETKRDLGFQAYLCRQLEAAAVNSLLQAARRTVPAGGPLSGGFAGEIYQGMADEEYARLIAASGSFGVGDAVFRQAFPAAGAVRTARAVQVPVTTEFGYDLKSSASPGGASRRPGEVR